MARSVPLIFRGDNMKRLTSVIFLAASVILTGCTSPAARAPESLAAAGPEPVCGRAWSDQEYLQSLPTIEKIGLALQAFSAGVAGRESPIDKRLREKRAQYREDQADCRANKR